MFGTCFPHSCDGCNCSARHAVHSSLLSIYKTKKKNVSASTGESFMFYSQTISSGSTTLPVHLISATGVGVDVVATR